VRAMPDGGTLTVTLDAVEEGWRIRFRDTGQGISPQLIEKIFEPFQSGFEGGTGLGLAIVYRIIQAHDAHITVRSEPGKGTEFTLLFRRKAETAEPESEDENLSEVQPTSHTAERRATEQRLETR